MLFVCNSLFFVEIFSCTAGDHETSKYYCENYPDNKIFVLLSFKMIL